MNVLQVLEDNERREWSCKSKGMCEEYMGEMEQFSSESEIRNENKAKRERERVRERSMSLGERCRGREDCGERTRVGGG